MDKKMEITLWGLGFKALANWNDYIFFLTGIIYGRLLGCTPSVLAGQRQAPTLATSHWHQRD